MSSLSNVSVLIAGAGLAGLTAARDLVKLGAAVTVIDARDRVGGRVLTWREPFVESQHAEAGADMIDKAHTEVCDLARELGLSLTRILRSGFGVARLDPRGRVRIAGGNVIRGWERLTSQLSDLGNRYRLAEKRWDSPIARAMARRSVAQWLDEVRADAELRAIAIGLRGFFLADPEELSLLALVDQFASDATPAPGHAFRIEGGNDRLAQALASALGERVQLGCELVAVSHRGQNVRASVKRRREVAQLQADYLVLALPAGLIRRIPISPALPVQQHEALSRLAYGNVTKTALQFSERFWRATGRPRAFGTPLPIGAAWEGNEEQRGRPGILSLMAGGGASRQTQDIVAHEGMNGLVKRVDWLGSNGAELLASRQIAWEAETWSRGGYAVFDPGYDPALREWLARPCDRLFFAGEHTSIAWQGYMNGAVESGRRAAAEIEATHNMGS